MLTYLDKLFRKPSVLLIIGWAGFIFTYHHNDLHKAFDLFLVGLIFGIVASKFKNISIPVHFSDK